MRRILPTFLIISLGSPVEAADRSLHLTLPECIDLALENNHRRPVSRKAVEVAEALHGQAVSSYWPQAVITSSITRMDHDPEFIFPEETDTYLIEDILPTPIGTTVTIPNKTVKLLDRTLFKTVADFTMPLYLGGSEVLFGSRREPAWKQHVRRSDARI